MAQTPASATPEIESPPAPGTALALAQRAKTYAASVNPDRPARSRHAPSNDLPDPDAMTFTPQVQIQPSANSAAAVAAEPAKPLAVAQADAHPSVNVPTVQKLVSGDGSNDFVDRILTRAKDYGADLSAQTDAQILKFVRDEPVPDLSSMAGLPTEDRELLSALMDSLSNFRNQLRADNNMLFSKKIRPLVELADRLRSQAELSVPTVALCTKVDAFGVYRPIDPARFVAGKEGLAVIYCEVENFLSQPNDKGMYETKLTQDVVLYTESSGLPVWSDHQSSYDDLSRRRRHDFFMAKRISLPANLTIGRYLLKVTVQDQQARHIAENTVPVEIVAQ